MRVRPILLLLALVLVVVGLNALARGDEEPAVDPAELLGKVSALEAQTAVLEAQIAYLMSREEDLTGYVVAAKERGAALVGMVGRMRAQGFQNRAIPAESRETLLRGLEALGKNLIEDVPVVTRAQSALLRAAKRR